MTSDDIIYEDVCGERLVDPVVLAEEIAVGIAEIGEMAKAFTPPPAPVAKARRSRHRPPPPPRRAPEEPTTVKLTVVRTDG